MNYKQLIIVTCGIILSMGLVLSIVLLVYKYEPALLGFNNPQNQKDSVKVNKPVPSKKVNYEPKVYLTQKQFDDLQKNEVQKNVYKAERDTLLSLRKMLFDSLSRLQKSVYQQRDSFFKYKNLYDVSEKNNLMLTTKLNKINPTEKSRELSEEIKNRLRQDSLNSLAQVRSFAKIYNNSTPESVAKVLEQLDNDTAAEVLKNMDKKKAGKILDIINSRKAKEILLSGRGKTLNLNDSKNLESQKK